MNRIVESLSTQQHRNSTKSVYIGVWRSFNKFLIRLDEKPRTWEERVTLYVGYLVKKGMQSATIRSYISGIKAVIQEDGYEWSDKNAKLLALTKNCRLHNDLVKNRLPIQNGLLELILLQVEVMFNKQIYLEIMWKCLFLIAYFGLFRVGELTLGSHTIKAKDIYVDKKHKKLKIYLYSSKTHGKESRPQSVKIQGKRTPE